MKKTYIAPAVEITNVAAENSILTVSNNTIEYKPSDTTGEMYSEEETWNIWD